MTLSKPSSPIVGKSGATSISRASRSRIALRYSVRLRRLNVSVRPDSDSRVQSDRANLRATSRGRVAGFVRSRDPPGGIWRARSFRTTFSHSSGWPLTSSVLMLERSRLPAFTLVLWQKDIGGNEPAIRSVGRRVGLGRRMNCYRRGRLLRRETPALIAAIQPAANESDIHRARRFDMRLPLLKTSTARLISYSTPAALS